jgi:hypothetical protein
VIPGNDNIRGMTQLIDQRAAYLRAIGERCAEGYGVLQRNEDAYAAMMADHIYVFNLVLNAGEMVKRLIEDNLKVLNCLRDGDALGAVDVLREQNLYVLMELGHEPPRK